MGFYKKELAIVDLDVRYLYDSNPCRQISQRADWGREETVIYATLIILGLMVGSFLNVCIFRLPRELSIVTPRSFCPRCRSPIRWYDNIPLFSYIILLGKCRNCKRGIPIRYPAVEIISALFSWYVFYHFRAWPPYVIYYLLLISPLIVITFIDIEHKIIPDVITIPCIAAGVASRFILMHGKWTSVGGDTLAGILVGGGSLAIIAFVYEWFKKREGLGGGDIKLAAMLGAFFGWKGVIFILFISSFIGSLVGVIFLILFKKDFKYAMPYGPFLAAGALIHLFWGDVILNWYLSLI